jgi:tetratricopeptide (TPR) repeat protein
MYNLLIALGALLVTLGIFLAAGVGWWGAILPATIAFAVAYFFLARRSLRQFEGIMLEAQKELTAKRVEPGLAKMKEAFPLAKWQFLIEPQIHAQLGMVLYMLQRFDDAFPHLEKSFVRIGQARAMLGALHFKRKNYDEMTKVFEQAVQANKKDGFLWSIYAWCLDKIEQREKALAVLSRALKESPGDEKLKANQLALQNNERLRMKAYGTEWYAFHLEKPPADVVAAMNPGAPAPFRKGYRQPPKQR